VRHWKPDQIDLWCEQWAKERRMVLGIDLEKLQPRERLGKLSCTLGQVREEGEGASQSTFNQNFPEVYTGMALEVHRGFCAMNGQWRQVMDAHYVWRPLTVRAKIAVLKIPSHEYWSRLARLKIYLSGALGLNPEELRCGVKREKVNKKETPQEQRQCNELLLQLSLG